MGSAVLQHPIWGTHSEKTLCLGDVLLPRWTVLPPLPAPWCPGTSAFCLLIVILVVRGN